MQKFNAGDTVIHSTIPGEFVITSATLVHDTCSYPAGFEHMRLFPRYRYSATGATGTIDAPEHSLSPYCAPVLHSPEYWAAARA